MIENAQPALFRIRPLQWKRKFSDWSQAYVADVPMGCYRVQRLREDCEPGAAWEGWRMEYCFDEYHDEGFCDVGSVSEGKQLAQEDWLQRILPALVAVA